jgi:DNA-binding response OmpR family regulator
MRGTPISVLLVEDNDADADYIGRSLRRAEQTRFDVSRVGWISSALTALGNRTFDIVLLDLSLPDCQGVDTLVRLMQAAPMIPVIVMTGNDDMSTGIQSVRYGAQDYLIKGDVGDRALERSIVYAIERKRSELVGKRLMRESISSVTSPGRPAATSMVQDHLGRLSDFIQELRTYVARNAPAHADNLEAIISKNDVDVVMREVRSITAEPDRSVTKRLRKISDMAIEAVRSISEAAPPVEAASARDTMLQVIEESARLGAQYGKSGSNG